MRDDLAALTLEVVASLANLGLAKRALREIEQGKGPELEESAEGRVTGRFPDGAVVAWPTGVSMRDATCSCGAAGACRHRAGLALAYGPWARASVSVHRVGDASASPAAASAFVAWSPAEFSDAALAAHLGARAFDAAKAARSRGLLARVRPPTAVEPSPTVALTSCTVRFLVPHALTFARCDCQLGEACLHVALAVWAAQKAGAAIDGERTVELAAAADAIDPGALEPLRDLARWVVTRGVADVASSGALAQRAALARRPIEQRGYVWMLTLLDDLESLVVAYAARSARYTSHDLVRLVVEIEARSRSALAAPHELPPSFVLGRDTPLETRLDHLRLTSLGAHVTIDGRSTTARLLLANPETGDVLALDRAFEAAEGAPPLLAADVASRRVGGATLHAIATGHVVTRAAVRRANDELVLRGGRQGSTSVMPQTGDFTALEPPRRVDRVADLRAHLAARAPRVLRPRRLGEDVFVFAVAELGPVTLDAAEQAVFAPLVDADGDAVLVARRHARAAPHALDVVGAALTGRWGRVRWIAGSVERGASSFVVSPTMIVADRVVVPDFEPHPGPVELDRGRTGARDDDARRAALGVLERLVEAAHTGFDELAPTFADRLERAASDAAFVGLAALSERAVAAARALRARDGDRFERWIDASIRAHLTLDA